MALTVSSALPAFAENGLGNSEIAEKYGLDEKVVNFLTEHNVDLSIFNGAQPSDNAPNMGADTAAANSYNASISSLMAQADAYGFTDEQINSYIRGLINTASKPLFPDVKSNSTAAMPVDDEVRLDSVNIPVIINGINFTGIDSEYPLCSVNDVVYFPLAYEYAGFLGLKTSWFERGGGTYKVLFVGVAGDDLVTPHINPKQSSVFPATAERNLPYNIALNAIVSEDFFNNAAAAYPFINISGVTYIPLSWQMCAQEFGWAYSYAPETGLVIDTSKPFRPYIDCRIMGYSHVESLTKFIYGDEYYAGFDTDKYSPEAPLEFRVCKRGENEKTYEIVVPEGEYHYVNHYIDSDGKDRELNSCIDGNTLSVAYRYVHDTGTDFVKVTVNLDDGSLISIETLSSVI